MKSIAILLTVHNRKDTTLSCLSQIKEQVYDKNNFRLVVYLVDDGSSDGTSEAVALKYPDTIIIKGDGTLFWNRGMYLAWDKAANDYDYDFYLWLNDDTFIYHDCISRLLVSSISHNNKCIIVGSCCWMKDKLKTAYGGYINRKRISNVSIERKCQTMNGNIVLIPRSVFKVLGNLDYSFHHGCGDFDYGYRAGKAGIDIYVSEGYFGECNRHEKVDKWADYKLPLKKRIKAFNFNHRFEDSFRLAKRHQGVIYAMTRSSSAIIHLLIPRIYDIIFGKRNL